MFTSKISKPSGAINRRRRASTDARSVVVNRWFSNEEVGSLTRQGADSTFLKDTLLNIIEGMDVSHFAIPDSTGKVPTYDKALRMLVDNSFMMSA
ncbi:MAG: hypothetical protein IIX68_02335, partial [Clostridia bacterium]|nr:hypothetical protein [Clostridia bacterium]